jgi:hypothetical protein
MEIARVYQFNAVNQTTPGVPISGYAGIAPLPPRSAVSCL